VTGESIRILVFDVGGTTIRAGLYDSVTDAVSSVSKLATPSAATLPGIPPAEVRARLYATMEALAEPLLDRASAVSIAFPGPVDDDGRVLRAPAIWGDAEPVPLRDEIARRWAGTRVEVLNDMSAAGFRYLRGRHDSLCIVTISTGIGHKIFVDGRPLIGSHGRGGELGHLRVDDSDDAPLCHCGERGHLSAVASGSATRAQALRFAAREPEGFEASELHRRCGSAGDVDNETLAAVFRQDDVWTRELVERMMHPLGRTLAGVHLGVGVERFVIVGGFALALGRGLIEILARTASGCSWDLGQRWDAMIELGSPDDDSGLIGAGRFAAREPRG
jgi:glucokinase